MRVLSLRRLRSMWSTPSSTRSKRPRDSSRRRRPSTTSPTTLCPSTLWARARLVLTRRPRIATTAPARSDLDDDASGDDAVGDAFLDALRRHSRDDDRPELAAAQWRTILAQAQRDDEMLGPTYARLHAARSPEDESPSEGRFKLVHEIVFWLDDRDSRRGQIYVPFVLRRAVMAYCHDDARAGHQGENRTAALVAQRYYWPGYFADVKRFVQSCPRCQRHKQSRQAPAGPF
eukprot:Opistho-1_new@48061